MPRTPPPADLDPSQIPALIGSRKREPILSVELAVVTPMFGGGATPRVTDPDVPIRGSSIRGHLRFWWRACKARGFASVEELHREESRIWGKSAAGKRDDPVGPSDIDVSVEILDPGRENPGFVAQQRSSATALWHTPSFHFRRTGARA